MSDASDPVRVLVTGFGPFPGVPHNASSSLALALQESPVAANVKVATAIIPVVWATAKLTVRKTTARFQPHAILHFGVSKRSAAFEIETRAYNMSGRREDHAGEVRRMRSLVRSGQPVLYATLPPRDLLRALRKNGIAAALSEDAGRYLCNALFYWSLHDGERDGRLVSFVHMPAFGAGPEVEPLLTMKDAVTGARILVHASAEAVLRARQDGLKRGGSIGHGSQALHRDGRGGGVLGGGDG